MPTKNRRLIAFAVGLLLCRSVLTSADVKPSMVPVFQAKYDADDAAFMRQDVSTLMRDETSDFISLDAHGEGVDRSGQKRVDNYVYSHAHLLHCRTQVLAAIVHGDEATVKQKTELAVTSDSRIGQPKQITVISSCRDSWVRLKGHWYCRRSQSMSDQTFENGQRVATTYFFP